MLAVSHSFSVNLSVCSCLIFISHFVSLLDHEAILYSHKNIAVMTTEMQNFIL